MGNCCYVDVIAYQEYKAAIGQRRNLRSKNFIWGSGSSRQSFMYFVDIKNHKYHKLDVPKETILYNICGTTMIDGNTIAIAGGVTYTLDFISRDFYLYHIRENSFEKMPPMGSVRFCFPMVYRQKCLFVFGGRSYGSGPSAITSSCEVFSFKTLSWRRIAPMHEERSGGTAILYRDQIWVIGGCNGSGLGSVVEFYTPELDMWTKLEERLPFDYFNFACCPDTKDPDSLIIFGGSNARGTSHAIHSLNLRTQRYVSRGQFLAKRSGFKCFFDESLGELIAIGGISDSSNQRLEFAEMVSFANSKKGRFISFPIIFQGDDELHMEFFNQSLVPIVLESGWGRERSTEESLEDLPMPERPRLRSAVTPLMHIHRDRLLSDRVASKEVELNETRHLSFIFGTDNEPFIVSVNSLTGEAQCRDVPWGLKLLGHQGTARISAEKVVLAGGVNLLFNLVEDAVFELNLDTMEVVSLPNMRNLRFLFNFFCLKRHLYAVGGRGYGAEQVSVMRECERYSFAEQKWSPIANLNEGRCQAAQFLINGTMFVAGGLSARAASLTSIELYNEKLDQWEIFGPALPSPLMGLSCLKLRDETVIFVGGMTGADERVHDFVLSCDLSQGDLARIVPVLPLSSHFLAKCLKIKGCFFIFGGMYDKVDILDEGLRNVKNTHRAIVNALEEEIAKVSHESYGLTKCAFAPQYEEI